MINLSAFLIAAALFGVIAMRCICVLYHAHSSNHPHGFFGFSGFGYSYVALATAAACVLAWTIVREHIYIVAAAWLFLVASVGMILFDRRPRRKCLGNEVKQ